MRDFVVGNMRQKLECAAELLVLQPVMSESLREVPLKNDSSSSLLQDFDM